MQFKKSDYIYYGAIGICVIDDICEMPFDGAKEGVLYYVMHTLSTPCHTIYNPIDNTRVLMRLLLSREEAERLLSAIPTMEAMQAENARLLREQYLQAMKSADPFAWARVLKTYHTRKLAADMRLVRVTEAERGFFESALRQLSDEAAIAFRVSHAEAEERFRAALLDAPHSVFSK